MKFIVAGCGIGGLAAALALSRSGHQVTLLEKTQTLEPVGAGISMQPNAMQALRYIGVDQTLKNAAFESDTARVLTSDGKPVNSFDFSSFTDRFGFMPVTIHRGDLIRVLHESLNRQHADIILGDGLTEFEQSDQSVVVQTESGRSIQCDGLVGADGIHSNVRAQLWGRQRPIYSGYTCWRGIVDNADSIEQCDAMTELWGPGSRFGYMRCNERQVYWFATENRANRTDDQQDDSWKKRYEFWVTPIPMLLQMTPSETIVHNDIVDLGPIFPWGAGNVTLLGDAAHAMTPNFGQGGAQAIEDAVILSRSVDQFDSLQTAFRQYETYRHQRTSELVKRSRQFGRIAQGGSFVNRLLRMFVLPNMPGFIVDRTLSGQCDFETHLAGFEAS